MSSPFVFISYRRSDALAAARGLMRFLQMHYGSKAVFMDTAEIRVGDDWKRKIESALERATVLIPIVGRYWLKLTDEFGRPRIDKKDDWVRREIAYAYDKKKAVLPIYVGVDPLPEQAFPPSLKRMADTQSLIVRGEDFEWPLLGSNLQRLGFDALRGDVVYPRATVKLEPLDEQAMSSALASLPGWRSVASPVPGMEHVTRSELHARFEFATFEQAMHFMTQSVPEICSMQHHPRWENIWRTVDVYLSTWDLQFQISQLDVALAKHLTKVARELGGDIR